MEDQQTDPTPQVLNQPAVTPAFVPDSSAPQKSKLPAGLAGALLVFLIIAGAAGAYFYNQNQRTDKRVPPTAPTPTVTSEPDTTIWQSYTNSADYSFDYPSNWNVIDEQTGSTATFESATVQIFDPKDAPTEMSFTGIRIEYVGMQMGLDLSTTQEVTINGIPMRRQDSMHGENYYVNIPDTDQFLYITGAGGHTQDEQRNQTIKRIFSTFKFVTPDQTSPVVTQQETNGAPLEGIQYTLPTGWTGTIQENTLLISAPGGGYLSIKIYDYIGAKLDLEYCKVKDVCVSGQSAFTSTQVGNVSGLEASGLDNSGGGREFIGAKGNKMYVISTFSPPSPNEYEKNFQTVLNSLKF